MRLRHHLLVGFAALLAVVACAGCGGSAPSPESRMSADTAYLATNRAKPGVTTLPSGLQYRVITAGKGRKPRANDQVTVHYRGTLVDGSEFDSSYKRNAPATFPVGGVIAGWVEALQLMEEGSTWELVIPAPLAYGARGAGGVIPPNATLIFQVELLSIR
jgi:FKBP-type peptidyl-prolyl cis-trans isomerase FklB